MEYYNLKLGGLNRELPIIKVAPSIKIASFNLLGDVELVNVSAKLLCKKLDGIKFDVLVGPEVKVVPLIYKMADILGQKNYVIVRKNIMGYMVSPIKSEGRTGLVLDGRDAQFIKNKKVVIVDDVVSTGKTLKVVVDLMKQVGANVVETCAIFKQGDPENSLVKDLMCLAKLPVFAS